MLSERARARIDETTSTSFSCDLRKWLQIMETYEGGGHAYHATLPTDGLRRLAQMMHEAEAVGFEAMRTAQQAIGDRIRALLEARGYRSVAADGFKAPCVVVSYTDDAEMQNGRRFMALGMQIAAGVPLQVDEPADFKTFRLGLFGLDKLCNVDRTVRSFEEALTALG
jgi:aspartate aminotransferase-like enzyme